MLRLDVIFEPYICQRLTNVAIIVTTRLYVVCYSIIHLMKLISVNQETLSLTQFPCVKSKQMQQNKMHQVMWPFEHFSAKKWQQNKELNTKMCSICMWLTMRFVYYEMSNKQLKFFVVCIECGFCISLKEYSKHLNISIHLWDWKWWLGDWLLIAGASNGEFQHFFESERTIFETSISIINKNAAADWEAKQSEN